MDLWTKNALLCSTFTHTVNKNCKLKELTSSYLWMYHLCILRKTTWRQLVVEINFKQYCTSSLHCYREISKELVYTGIKLKQIKGHLY